MDDSRKPSNERLYALYHTEKKSLHEIGRSYGVSGALVLKWMRRAGIATRSISEGTSLAQKGRPLSEEHRRINAENLVKARAAVTPEGRERHRQAMLGRTPPNKGKSPSEETRAIWRAQRSDPEYRQRMRERFLGEKSPNWKGGVKAEHNRRLDHADWRRRRREVYERDNWICQDCGVKCKNNADSKFANQHKRKIQAHHIVSRRDGGSDELENLVTLCMSCHHKCERNGAK